MSKENITAEITKEELANMLQMGRRIFDVVRIVDATLNIQFELGEDGELIPEDYSCYAIWEKNKRCSNCVSAKTLVTKKTSTKFEFVHGDVYFVISHFIIYQENEFVVEMVKQIQNDVLFDAYGKDSFVDLMNQFNDKIYKDELTGAYNRRYFNEQQVKIARKASVVLLDIDKFKTLNDTYGHKAGDMALQALVQSIQANIRESDKVIRLGGDEFILIFENIPIHILEEKLNHIREGASYIRFEEYPELEMTISMGAVATPGDIHKTLVTADEMLYVAKEKRNTIQIYEKHEKYKQQ